MKTAGSLFFALFLCWSLLAPEQAFSESRTKRSKKWQKRWRAQQKKQLRVRTKRRVQRKRRKRKELKLYSHTTTGAHTNGHLKFSFKKPTRSNFDDSAFVNDLTLGFGDRFEIGTSPFFLLAQAPNVSGKLNLFKSSKMMVSLGSSFVHITGDNEGKEFALDWFSLAPILSFRLPKTSTIASFQVTYEYYSWLNEMLVFEHQVGEEHSIGFFADLGFKLSRAFRLTTGVSYHTPPDFRGSTDPDDFRQKFFGLGASVTWLRPKKFFSAPSLGAHFYPEISSVGFLISTEFY